MCLDHHHRCRWEVLVNRPLLNSPLAKLNQVSCGTDAAAAQYIRRGEWLFFIFFYMPYWTDAFSEFLKMFSIPLHHSMFEVPNFFDNRISVKSRFVTKPFTPSQLSPIGSRQKIVRPVSMPPSPPKLPSSPLGAITDGIKDRLKAIYPGTLWCGDGNQARSHNQIGLFRNTDICWLVEFFTLFHFITCSQYWHFSWHYIANNTMSVLLLSNQEQNSKVINFHNQNINVNWIINWFQLN